MHHSLLRRNTRSWSTPNVEQCRHINKPLFFVIVMPLGLENTMLSFLHEKQLTFSTCAVFEELNMSVFL